MYYKLNERYLLRGWQLLPYGVVDRQNGLTSFVPREVMDVLQLATGTIDFALPLVSDAQRELAKKLAEEGAIVACEERDPILDRQHYRLHDNRYMASAHWSMTGNCNYRCKHCYMWAFEGRYGELSHGDALRMVDELAECGVHRISLTGGEPLLRSDFLEIVDALRERDITVFCIYSNGALVDERLLSALEERGMCPEFNMSFDGTEGWHDWLRGVDGATAAVDRAFRLCREHGFPTGAEMCLHEGNKQTLRDSVNYLASVGCRALKTNPVSDVGAWHDSGLGTSIGMEDLFEVYLDYIPHYYEDGKPLTLQLGGFFMARPGADSYVIPSVKPGIDPDKYCVCGHARSSLYISAEGRALPCMALSGMDIQKNYPIILEKGLRSCLSDSTYIDLVTAKASEVLDHNERCHGCEHARECCGGCRASALDSHPDDIMAIDEAVCRIFKGGYIQRIEQAVRSVAPNEKRA